MSLDQPAHQHNYTKIGFLKRKLPDNIFKRLKDFFEENKHKEKAEQWPRGNTYVNHWKAPTYMVSFEDPTIKSGYSLKQDLWDEVKPIISEWTGQELTESSLYGIRVYKNNSDIDEPWPVEVIGHDGKAYNVTMEPGDMVLYESHTVLHGRPFPLNGRFYANVFVHYIPKAHDAMNRKDLEETAAMFTDPKTTRKFGGHENQNHDMARGEARFQLEDGQTELHIAAQVSDLNSVKSLLENASPTLLHARDANNWQAIHEAARAGSLPVLRLLVERGADVTARTLNGGSVLYWAKSKENNENVVKYLESIGAPFFEEET
eukprot:GSChrysophyteH1.ASY1.ANO1.601.1 assembled CDS